jgi:hypothetical protein
MATSTQTVIIDFQSDFSSVQEAVDILQKAGKVDKELADSFRKANAEINRQGQAFDKAAQSANKNNQTFSKLEDLLKKYPQTGLRRFLLQIGDELAKAGLRAEDFYTTVNEGSTEAEKKTLSLRQELKLVKEQMQQAAINGGVLSEEYQRLKERAGELDDTIKDVADDIANAGSDTRGIDNVVGSISALAGAFSFAQGAAALFGNESEDVQKALLKVNAAMAIATGLQQVSNALTKQGSLTRLADATATQFQIVAQKLYDATLKGSIVSLKAFKIALATTGIGLLIIGVTALINKFNGASEATKKLNKDLQDLNDSVEASRQRLREEGEIIDAQLEEQGKSESERSKARQETLKGELIAEQNAQTKRRDRLKELTDFSKKMSIQEAVDRKKGIEAVEKEIAEGEKRIHDIRQEQAVLGIRTRTQEKDEAKKAAEEAERLAKEAAEKAKERRASEFADFKAHVELKLLAAQKGSEEELKIRKQLLLVQLQIDLENDKLTQNQRKLLIQQYFKDVKDLAKSFNNELAAQGLEEERNRISAALENLNLAEEDRLALRIEYLQLAAAEEILQADGNAAKIKAINAKLQADIVQAKIDAINKAAQYELRLAAATNGPARRALDRVAADEKMKADVRINALNQILAKDLEAIDREIKANRDAAKIKGADQAELNLQLAELEDKRAQKVEETEEKITAITKAAIDERLQNAIAYIGATIQGLQQISDIISSIQANQQAVTDAAIQRQRKEIDHLLETGIITEKEAEKRRRKVDAEERAAKNKAAQQTKNLAVFNAFLQIPQAYIAGLTAPPPVGGPIYAALLAGLAAAQASIIAAQPVPRFATGKKGSYEGLGIVGDAGAELIERSDGRMEVAPKRTITYLGPKDKVFTASETKTLLPMVNRDAMKPERQKDIDYDKLAQAIMKGIKIPEGTQINIDREFISESVANGLLKNNYFGQYYSSK